MNDRLLTATCQGSVNDVLTRLLTELERRGVQLFAIINHGQAAQDVGLELSDEVVAVFGNAAVGTRLMQRNARVGIDLPLRILIWDDEGTTKTAYSPPTDLAEKFALDTAELPVAQLAGLLEELTIAIRR